MKEDKTWFGKKYLPENEWEAKFISDSNASANDLKKYYYLAIVGLSFCIFGLLYGIVTKPCEFELTGNFTGNMDLNTANIPALKDFQLTGFNGTMKMNGGQCGIIDTAMKIYSKWI